MVQISSLENFIRKSIWQLTRQGDIQKYIPKELKNGVVVGDCAVIKNKSKLYDVFSKQRKPLKKNISNHKIAIVIATIMSQYTDKFKEVLRDLTELDTEYSNATENWTKYKAKIKEAPHLEVELDEWEEQVYVLSNEIEKIYCEYTI
jgi:hypothetical protein